MLWNLGLLKGGWTFEMPRSGTLDLRSVAERRLFWFLRAVLKLSSLCKAAADTAREEPSAILLLTTKQMSSLRAVSQSCHLAWVAAVADKAGEDGLLRLACALAGAPAPPTS